jgi:hypothetical protein
LFLTERRSARGRVMAMAKGLLAARRKMSATVHSPGGF